MKIFKPAKELLEDDFANALEESEEFPKEWLEQACKSAFECLKMTPMQYRDYGPYWWLLKRALIDNVPEFKARSVDAEWFEMMDYGESTINVFVALDYLNSQNLQTHSNYHSLWQLYPDDDGSEYPEPYEYTLVDEEMESLEFLGD